MACAGRGTLTPCLQAPQSSSRVRRSRRADPDRRRLSHNGSHAQPCTPARIQVSFRGRRESRKSPERGLATPASSPKQWHYTSRRREQSDRLAFRALRGSDWLESDVAAGAKAGPGSTAWVWSRRFEPLGTAVGDFELRAPERRRAMVRASIPALPADAVRGGARGRGRPQGPLSGEAFHSLAWLRGAECSPVASLLRA